jgi:GntR family transcriptional repressor for pyruvate dehydrogenase complex
MSKMKLSDTILEDLNKRILTGEFRNGQKLPTERELAAYYNTSRIPVRAALKQLAEDGVVKTAPSSGTTVISSGNTLAIPSKALSGWENSAVFYETISLRTLIEAEAAKYAAAARTAEDIKNIQNTLLNQSMK